MMRNLFIPFTLALSGFLTGCGFSPMHGATGANTPLANMNVEMKKGSNVVDNQAGFFITQRLRDRIGTESDAAPYRLEITPNYSRTRFGLTNADVASRYDITVTAKWTLFDSKTGDSLDNGRTLSTVTFGAPAGPYGVITADSVGVEQSAQETADKLVVELARYFAAENKKAKK